MLTVPQLQALIQQFFAVEDGAKRHPETTGQLMAARLLPPYEPDATLGTDFERLALQVGAAACRMIEFDVGYLLREGRGLMSQTLPSYTQLATSLAAPNASAGSKAFARYAMMRWANAAGRLAYRNKDWPQASRLFEASFREARGHPAVSARFDIGSDFARTLFERWRGTPREKEGKDDCICQLTALLRDFVGAGPTVLLDDLVTSAASHRTAGHLDHEAIKGLGNVLHNLALLTKNPHHLTTARAVAQQAGDLYRIEQIGHELALDAMIKDPNAICLQRQQLAGMARRNALVRRQRIATALAKTGKLDAAKDELSQMLDDLKRQRDRLGTDYFDQDVHGYVLDNLAGVLNNVYASGFDAPEWNLMLREYRDLAESHRSLTSIVRYRTELTSFVLNRMRQSCGIRMSRWRMRKAGSILFGEVARADQPELEEIVDAAELASCRELLDVLSALSLQPAVPPVDYVSVSGPRADLFYGYRGSSGTPKLPPQQLSVLTAILANADIDKLVTERAVESARELESRFEEQTVPAVLHRADVLHQAIQYTRQEKTTVLVRFIEAVLPGDTDRKQTELGAVVIEDGRVHFHTLGKMTS